MHGLEEVELHVAVLALRQQLQKGAAVAGHALRRQLDDVPAPTAHNVPVVMPEPTAYPLVVRCGARRGAAWRGRCFGEAHRSMASSGVGSETVYVSAGGALSFGMGSNSRAFANADSFALLCCTSDVFATASACGPSALASPSAGASAVASAAASSAAACIAEAGQDQ